MLFTTGAFLFVYLPVTLGGFFLIARFAGVRIAAAWLVLASMFFYACWRPVHVLLLVASICFNYWAGGLILRAREPGSPTSAKRLLVFAIATNLLALAYFKYANFFIDTLNGLAGLHIHRWSIALPLGISFFTFTQIAYLADVYAGKVAERSPVRYALFVSYFPHLVAGPVLHHSQMMPQFREPRVYRPEFGNFAMGIAFLVAGLIKKVLVADSFAPIAREVFASSLHGAIAPEAAWRGILAYTLQIYFDFSGYSDMAIGLSRLIGVRLPYNFNSPYKALDIIDFWRRWHMTLSAFLRDYLYIPLGGNRKGPARRYVNLLLTMLLGGLWHGAAWTFVVWGGLHGIYLMVNHGWRRLTGRDEPVRARRPPSLAGRTLGNAVTMLAVMVAWVFFRAEDMQSATAMLGAMFGMTPVTAQPLAGWQIDQWFGLAALLLCARILPNTQEIIDGHLGPLVARLCTPGWRPALGMSVGAGIVAVVLTAMISASRQVTEFIYFNF
ncbi:MAG TPA: MBOAT family protein [Steroidobacteraceae bacterium]|nr:MBOAT family protein [Steroidobacteraceae bacterium]